MLKDANIPIRVTISGDHLTILEDDTNRLFKVELANTIKNYSIRVEPVIIRGEKGIMLFGQKGVLYQLLFDLAYNFDLLVV